MAVTEQNKKTRILLGQDNNALTWLIIINSVIFITLLFIKVSYLIGNTTSAEALHSFQTQIQDWFAIPASGYKFLSRPWTIFSYMFSHDSIWYFISSLLWLWCFGYILQDLAGNNKLFPLYFYGGITGAIAFLIAANLIPSLHGNIQNVSMMGAGASIICVAVATTMLAPKYRIFPLLNGGIPLWVITLVFTAIDFTSIGITDGAVAIAHIASALTGFLFISELKKGRDWSLGLIRFGDWANDLFNPEKKQNASKQLFYKSSIKPYEKTPHITQQKLDEILDKINQHGYHFLSDEEKEFLKKASKEDF